MAQILMVSYFSKLPNRLCNLLEREIFMANQSGKSLKVIDITLISECQIKLMVL